MPPIRDAPVRAYMTEPVRAVRDDAKIMEAHRLMAGLGISGVAVVDARGAPIGVLSRTDLLRIGRIRPLERARSERALTLPDSAVRQVMHPGVEVIAPDAHVSEAARRMVKHRHRRLFVRDHSRLIGVLTTSDVMRAVADAGIETPIGEIMHRSIVTVDVADPLSLAIDRLAAAHVTGLMVIADDWPAGVFLDDDALAARDARPDSPVEEWMDPAIVCLPAAMPAFRAARQACATRARRVIAVDAEGARGIVSGLDFARLAAT